MRTEFFDYRLPEELIAQAPSPKRDGSRLLVLDRSTGARVHHGFQDLENLVRRGDVLVLNDSKVLAARLHGQKPGSGGVVELLLLEEVGPNDWWAMVRPGKRVRSGSEVLIRPHHPTSPAIVARVLEKNPEGHCRVRFEGTADIRRELDRYGVMPLPPYIVRDPSPSREEDERRYQTVYARDAGSVAAPTAGLHFTDDILRRLASQGVEICRVTLHVGYGTFAPVKTTNVGDHPMHEERFTVPAKTAAIVNRAKAEGRRVIAVGTTSLRTIESVARQNAGRLVAGTGRTKLFLQPPAEFHVVDALLTNFHLPRSTLLMLVCAFAAPGEATRGRELVLAAYAEAIRERYRFFSYGDAMFIA